MSYIILDGSSALDSADAKSDVSRQQPQRWRVIDNDYDGRERHIAKRRSSYANDDTYSNTSHVGQNEHIKFNRKGNIEDPNVEQCQVNNKVDDNNVNDNHQRYEVHQSKTRTTQRFSRHSQDGQLSADIGRNNNHQKPPMKRSSGNNTNYQARSNSACRYNNKRNNKYDDIVNNNEYEQESASLHSRSDETQEAYMDHNECQSSLIGETVEIKELRKKRHEEIVEMCESVGINNARYLDKHGLFNAYLRYYASHGGNIISEGVIEFINDAGYAFVRSSHNNYAPSADDVYIAPNQAKKYRLRTGDTIRCTLCASRNKGGYFGMSNISSINGCDITERPSYRPHFDDLVPLYPDKRIVLEVIGEEDISCRVLQIVSPLGKGQRALIVAPPRTGKTVLMQNIAHAITKNHPEITLIVLLIDERPEEVTDMARSVNGEVVSSNFDEPYQRHVQVAEIVIEKAKRLVESKKDVVILLDSITRLARAYNNVAPSSGRVLSGGIDANALQAPKHFFGAARNIEDGGSLTIIATALIETGSRMDDIVFEEFKGTGNSEICLDRKISDKRVFPAIDVSKSGTRKEDLLLPKNQLSKIWILRKLMSNMSPLETIEFLIDKLKITESNDNFFANMDSYNPGNKIK